MENNLVYQMRLSLALKQRSFLQRLCYRGFDFECVHCLHRLMDIDKRLGKKEPIEIFINSNGGLLTECLSLISLIEQMKDMGYHIITINSGKAYLAVSLIGSERKSYRYAEYNYSLSAATMEVCVKWTQFRPS